MNEAALALPVLLLTLALAVGTLRQRGNLADLDNLLFRGETLRSEAERLHRTEQQLAQVQRISEAVMSGGTQTVRAIHRGIAAIPFGILESIPATRDTTRIVRASHDLISDAVYGTIGAVNRGVGASLRGGLKAGAPGALPAASHDSIEPTQNP